MQSQVSFYHLVTDLHVLSCKYPVIMNFILMVSMFKDEFLLQAVLYLISSQRLQHFITCICQIQQPVSIIQLVQALNHISLSLIQSVCPVLLLTGYTPILSHIFTGDQQGFLRLENLDTYTKCVDCHMRIVNCYFLLDCLNCHLGPD